MSPIVARLAMQTIFGSITRDTIWASRLELPLAMGKVVWWYTWCHCEATRPWRVLLRCTRSWVQGRYSIVPHIRSFASATGSTYRALHNLYLRRSTIHTWKMKRGKTDIIPIKVSLIQLAAKRPENLDWGDLHQVWQYQYKSPSLTQVHIQTGWLTIIDVSQFSFAWSRKKQYLAILSRSINPPRHFAGILGLKITGILEIFVSDWILQISWSHAVLQGGAVKEGRGINAWQTLRKKFMTPEIHEI